MARILLLLLALSALAFAPAPFPRSGRPPVPQGVAGSWDVKWAGMDAFLDLRPDGSARFGYVSGGAWDGSWKFDGAAPKVTLTLHVPLNKQVFDLVFSSLSGSAAKGVIRSETDRPLEMSRRR